MEESELLTDFVKDRRRPFVWLQYALNLRRGVNGREDDLTK